jgi:hypothetical protein
MIPFLSLLFSAALALAVETDAQAGQDSRDGHQRPESNPQGHRRDDGDGDECPVDP